MIFLFLCFNSNSSGSKELATTTALSNSQTHHRGHANTNGPGVPSNPPTPAFHDKYQDLIISAIKPRNRGIVESDDKVIIKNSGFEEPNPTLADVMEKSIR